MPDVIDVVVREMGPDPGPVPQVRFEADVAAAASYPATLNSEGVETETDITFSDGDVWTVAGLTVKSVGSE